MLRFTSCFFALALLCFIPEALSCGGYGLSIRKIKNCGISDLVQVNQKISVTLDENCDVIPRGCVKVLKTFQQFNASYSVAQDGLMSFEDTVDGCLLLKDEQMMKCPIKAGDLCVNGQVKISVAPYKDFLPIFVGDISVQMDVQHHPGKSCFKVDAQLYEKSAKSRV